MGWSLPLWRDLILCSLKMCSSAHGTEDFDKCNFTWAVNSVRCLEYPCREGMAIQFPPNTAWHNFWVSYSRSSLSLWDLCLSPSLLSHSHDNFWFLAPPIRWKDQGPMTALFCLYKAWKLVLLLLDFCLCLGLPLFEVAGAAASQRRCTKQPLLHLCSSSSVSYLQRQYKW